MNFIKSVALWAIGTSVIVVSAVTVVWWLFDNGMGLQ